MRVLGLTCSGRKGGNTEILVREALSAAAEAGAQTEIVLVAEKSIAPCDGCFSCQKSGICVIKDDMQPLYQKMQEADAIVFGSPVYFGTVSAQAKKVMDRTFLLLQRGKLKGKVGASVLAVRRLGGAQTRSLMYSYFIAHGMIPVRSAIGYGMTKGDVLQGTGGGTGISALEEARNVGRDVVHMVQQLAKP